MRYEKLKDFKSGFRIKEGAYFKRGARKIDCKELAVELNAFLKGVREGDAWAAEQGIDLYVTLSADERKTALDRVYNDVMRSILVTNGKWNTDRRGKLLEPISAYRRTEVHGQSHKSLAACLSWNDENATLTYLGWSAEKGRDWPTTKFFAVSQCRNLRLRERLHCECYSIDHDNENVLSLPDYILSRYEGLTDSEAVNGEDGQLGSVD